MGFRKIFTFSVIISVLLIYFSIVLVLVEGGNYNEEHSARPEVELGEFPQGTRCLQTKFGVNISTFEFVWKFDGFTQYETKVRLFNRLVNITTEIDFLNSDGITFVIKFGIEINYNRDLESFMKFSARRNNDSQKIKANDNLEYSVDILLKLEGRGETLVGHAIGQRINGEIHFNSRPVRENIFNELVRGLDSSEEQQETPPFEIIFKVKQYNLIQLDNSCST